MGTIAYRQALKCDSSPVAVTRDSPGQARVGFPYDFTVFSPKNISAAMTDIGAGISVAANYDDLTNDIDMPDTNTRDAVVQAAIDDGLFDLTCGERSLRFRPNLAFTEELAGEANARLRKAIDTVVSS